MPVETTLVIAPSPLQRRSSLSRRVGILLAAGAILVGAATACSSKGPETTGASGAAVDGFPGCEGLYNKDPSPTGMYFATDFGCSSDPYFTDPGDECGSAACIDIAYDENVCSSDQSHADCQRAINWYSIGAARYGCGTRLQVTNPANGKSVVVLVLDNGPNCSVENAAGFWVLDVSYPTIKHLFGQEEGYSDHAMVQAVVVDSSTPLGPNDGSDPVPPTPIQSNDAGFDGPITLCQADGDCNPGNDGSGQICTNGVCVPGCHNDGQCPGATTCVSGSCQ